MLFRQAPLEYVVDELACRGGAVGSEKRQQHDESAGAQARGGSTSAEHVVDLRDRPEREAADHQRERFALGQFNVLGLLPLAKKTGNHRQ